MQTRAEALNLMSKYLFLLVKDLRQCYELADDTLETLRNSNASSSSHSVSIGNHDQDSAKLWALKYTPPEYNKHKSHTKTMRRGADFDDIKNYVSTMAASRCVDHIEHYPIDELRKMFPPV